MKNVLAKSFKRAWLIAGLASLIAVGAPFSASALRSVTLAWVAPDDPGVTGYTIYYGTASHHYTQVAPVIGDTSITINNLIDGTTYFFAVSAHTLIGVESDLSDEISYDVPPPPPPFDGAYNGLFCETNAVRVNSTGFINLLVSTRSTYSGKLQLGAGRYPISGKFDGDGHATNVVQRAGAAALTVELNLGTDDQTGRIVGRVTDGVWIAELSSDRAAVDARAFAGSYTLVVPGTDHDPLRPAGDSVGTVQIDANGVARFAGTLADGTKITQTVPVSQNGQWPLYAALYSGKGLMTGWVNITNDAGSDLSGALSWIKPPDPKARSYPAGFAAQMEAIGSAYFPPIAGALILTAADASLLFTGGNLVSDFTNPLTLMPGGKVANLGDNKLTMNFSFLTGAFSGKVTDPASGKSFPFSGVVLQKLNAGYGFLMEPGQSSRVELSE